MLSDEESRILRRLRDDLEYYAPRVLRVRPPEGGMVPFKLTRQQKKLHAAAERQLREKGRVRIIVAKGRKTKTSTYVQARFFWKCTHRRGVKAFVMAHDRETTGELFDIADRFYRNAPKEVVPKATNNSVRELYFEELDTGYSVGTAGSAQVGRGFTPQYVHGVAAS